MITNLTALSRCVYCWLLVFFAISAFAQALSSDNEKILTVSGKTTSFFYNRHTQKVEILASGSIRKEIRLSYTPTALEADPAGLFLYVLNSGKGTLEIYDSSSSQLIKRVFVGLKPSAVAVHQTTGNIIVASQAEGKITVLDGQSHQTISMKNIQGQPNSVEMDEKNHRIFLTTVHPRSVLALDDSSLNVLNSFTGLDGDPLQVVVSNLNSKLYVREQNAVTAFYSTSLQMIDYLDLPALPKALFIDQEGSALYVALKDEDSICVFDTKNDRIFDFYSAIDQKIRGKKVDPQHWYFDRSDGQLHFFTKDGESVTSQELKQAAKAASGTSAPVPAFFTSGPVLIWNSDNTNGTQDLPFVGFDQAGNITVVYEDDNDGSEPGVFLREFDSTGENAQTSSFRANAHSGGNQGAPVLGALDNGDYVIAFRDSSGLDGESLGVFFRRFSNGGNPKDPQDVPIPNTTNGQQVSPFIAVEPASGDFVAVWTGKIAGPDVKQTLARRFNADGTPKENEHPANTTAKGTMWSPAVTTIDSGRYVAVWRDGNDNLSKYRVFDESGVAVGSELNVAPGKAQFQPTVAMDPDGNFTIAWRENGKTGIRYRQFDKNGVPLDVDKAASVKSQTANNPSISMAPNGNFVICWWDNNLNLFARHFFADGTPDGDEFQPFPSSNDQLAPNAAMDRDANFVLSWKERGGDGSAGTAYGRRFTTGPAGLNITCTANPQGGKSPLAVTFASTPSGGSGNYTFDWDFGDVTAHSNQEDPGVHNYNADGVYTATVTVDDGATNAMCSKIINVNSQAFLYSDDFSDGDPTDWVEDGGTWSDATTAHVGTVTGKATSVSPFEGCTVCSIRADIMVGTDEKAKVSLLGWHLDKGNSLELIMDKNKDIWILKQRSGGSKVAKGKANQPINPNQVYNANIVYDGTDFKVFIDNAPDPILTMPKGGTVSNGTVAFLVKKGTGTIDNVEVLP